MAISTGEFSYNSSLDWTQAIYNFAASHDSRLSMSDGKIRFDNKFSLSFTNNSATVTYDSDSSTKTIMSGNPYWASSGTCQVMLINDENNFYLTLVRKNYANQADTGFVVFKSDSGTYYAGGQSGQNPDYKNINACPIYDCIDPSVPVLKFGHVANYELETPKIIYSKKVPVVQQTGTGGVDFINSAYSCSSVPFGSNITIDGKNYYCAGTNIILALGV